MPRPTIVIFDVNETLSDMEPLRHASSSSVPPVLARALVRKHPALSLLHQSSV